MKTKTNSRSVPPGLYRHWKGNLYLVERTITDAGDGPKRPKAELPRRVIYWALYDGFEPWGRELQDFRSCSYRRLEKGGDERLVKRFQLICHMDALIPPKEKMEIAKKLKSFWIRSKRGNISILRVILEDPNLKPPAILTLLKLIQTTNG